jgi:predicted ester cyclase
MSDLLDRIVDVWMSPPADDASGVQAFQQCYADPVGVNGTPWTASGLLAYARALHQAFAGLHLTAPQSAESTDVITFVYQLDGRHTGPLQSPLGVVQPTGKAVRFRTIDVLTVKAGKVTSMWMAADELGLFLQLEAFTLR